MDKIDRLIEQHRDYTLLIGEQLAFLKRDWDAAFGGGLTAVTKRRRWAAFLRDHSFVNPEPFSSIDWITPEVADRLILRFQRHLMTRHLQAQHLPA